MTPYCTVNYSDQLATIEFGSPAHNALSGHILAKLFDHLQQITQNAAIRLILIKSQGEKSFSAGADLTELIRIEDEESGKQFFMQFARIILAIRSCPQIVITRVQGKAVGGALGLVAVSDLVYATDQASIRLSELINGIGPFVIGPPIERKTGLAHFNHLALNPATWLKASRARELGLYNEVFPTPEAMDQAINAKIEELQAYSSSAREQIKLMMWSGIPDWENLLEERAAISGRLVMTDEAKGALRRLMSSVKNPAL